ncbi:hypothetical protein VNO77_28186 [Canavalia gladiata]|uniref:Protein IQ-DOMAIN 1 n=1 Tax=Canavalia gladiata TaxID=3824 RepID=A0AAN9Q7N7_CANGL
MCCLSIYYVSYHYYPPPLIILSKQTLSVPVFSSPNPGMGPKKWFKIIVKLKKSKKDKSKQDKVQSNGMQSPHEDSSSIPNESLMLNRTVPSRLMGDIAATRIQNAFRSFMARRTLHHLRGAVKFEALIQDHMAREQTATALSYIHSWSRIQEQIRARRICMITEARIKQKKLENQLKLEAKIQELEVEWCSGSETMEEIVSRIHQREEAAIKRERAMAYAFSHQWRPNCSQYFGQASYSLGKESWGWSWMERWVAARPWEVRVRVHPTKTKKLNGQQQKTKLDKMNHNESKAPLAKPGKGKENSTSGLSKNNVPNPTAKTTVPEAEAFHLDHTFCISKEIQDKSSKLGSDIYVHVFRPKLKKQDIQVQRIQPLQIVTNIKHNNPTQDNNKNKKEHSTQT